MSFVMSPSADAVALSSPAILAQVQSGGNGSYSALPEYAVGSGAGGFVDGSKTWDPDLSNGLDSGWVTVSLDAKITSSGSTLTWAVQGGASGTLSTIGPGGNGISEVDLNVGVQNADVSVVWDSPVVKFYHANSLVETDSPTSSLVADTTSSGDYSAGDLLTVTPGSSNNDEVIVTGRVRFTCTDAYSLPAPTDIFAQVGIFLT